MSKFVGWLGIFVLTSIHFVISRKWGVFVPFPPFRVPIVILRLVLISNSFLQVLIIWKGVKQLKIVTEPATGLSIIWIPLFFLIVVLDIVTVLFAFWMRGIFD